MNFLMSQVERRSTIPFLTATLLTIALGCSSSSTAGGGGPDGAAAHTGGASSSGGASSGGASSGGGGGAGAGGAAGGSGGATGGAGGIATGGFGGLGSGGTLGDAGTVHCQGTPTSFPRFDGSCSNDSDCIIVHRQTDCCGSQSSLAIAKSAEGAFAAAEAICESQYPGCGCPPRPPTTATAQCLGGRCTAVTSANGSFPCGAATCTAGQYCSKYVGGNGGGSSICATDPSCAADCLYCGAGGGCFCVDYGGYTTVQCNGV